MMVHPNSHRVSRVPWYLGVLYKEATEPFAYGAITLYGGSFQRPFARLVVCNFLDPTAIRSNNIPRPQRGNDLQA